MKESKEKKLWDSTGAMLEGKKVSLGPYFSFQYRHTPRHILFTMSRYKFAQKMIGNGKNILELGCNEGVGCHYLAEFSKSVLGVDFDKTAIDWAQKHQTNEIATFTHDDFLKKEYGKFDAVVSYDVIEHIYPENEHDFLKTVVNNLTHDGICLVGTPNKEADKFSNPESREAHVNLHDGDSLVESLTPYFHNIFLFSMNDEVIHTGFSKMAHYLIALCAYKKTSDKN